MTDMELPRVSFAVIAYNQAQFIGAAIASALAQDYPNLEVILSDDCSPDETFEVMRRAVRAYHGPHTVVLNRNDTNLHIGGHINTVNRLATGQLIVIAAGDDLSDPLRTRKLVNAWLAGGKRAGLLHSACYRMTDQTLTRFDCPCLEQLDSLNVAARYPAFVIGATEAWDKSMFDHFGDLRSDLIHEDHALPFRSLLLGRPVTYVDEPLVSYRQGMGVSTIYGSLHVGPTERRLILGRYLVDAMQKIDDLAKAPQPGIAPLLDRVADQYRAAIRFEEGWPAPAEMLGWIRRTGARHIARMAAKRLRNRAMDAAR